MELLAVQYCCHASLLHTLPDGSRSLLEYSFHGRVTCRPCKALHFDRDQTC